MDYLAVKFKSGKMYCQSREAREIAISYARLNKTQVLGIVEKVFSNENDAKIFCDRINEVNNLIKNI